MVRRLRRWLLLLPLPRRCGEKLDFGHVMAVVGFPNRVADGTNVQVFHVFVVVAEKNHFVPDCVCRGVGGTQLVRTRYVPNSGQSRIVFGILVHDMVKFAFVLAKIGAKDRLTGRLFFTVATVSTVVH